MEFGGIGASVHQPPGAGTQPPGESLGGGNHIIST